MAAQNDLIIDASVIVKWFIDEEDSNKAISLLDDLQNNRRSVVVPSLVFYEVGNSLLFKKTPINRISEIMVILQDLFLGIEDMGLSNFRKIYQNSIEYSLTFYDAAYITLMQKENCRFVTADGKLFQKVHKNFKGIKLLSG